MCVGMGGQESAPELSLEIQGELRESYFARSLGLCTELTAYARTVLVTDH